jgi:hypothetical protein
MIFHQKRSKRLYIIYKWNVNIVEVSLVQNIV